MKKIQVLFGVACVSLFLATGALAEIQDVQAGTSDNLKGNVPKEIQRDGGAVSPGDSGPGQRDDASVGMKKEQPELGSQQDLKQNVEKTHGGGAAIAAEQLGKTSVAAEDSKNEMDKKDK